MSENEILNGKLPKALESKKKPENTNQRNTPHRWKSDRHTQALPQRLERKSERTWNGTTKNFNECRDKRENCVESSTIHALRVSVLKMKIYAMNLINSCDLNIINIVRECEMHEIKLQHRQQVAGFWMWVNSRRNCRSLFLLNERRKK